MAEIVKCRFCGAENESTAAHCACGRTDWKVYPHGLFGGAAKPQPTPEPDFLRSIDDSLTTIKHIALYFMVLSILGLLLGFLVVIGAFR